MTPARVWRILGILWGIGVIAGAAWIFHEPRVEPDDADTVRNWLVYALARWKGEPLQLPEFRPVGKGRYTGQARASDGRVYQVVAEVREGRLHYSADYKDPMSSESVSGSTGPPPFAYRHPGVMRGIHLFGFLMFSLFACAGVISLCSGPHTGRWSRTLTGSGLIVNAGFAVWFGFLLRRDCGHG